MEILEFELSVTGKATSNIELYKNSVLAQIEELKTKELITEDDFSSAEKVVKVCKEQEKKLVEAKQKAQDESASIKDVFAAIDQAQNIFRDTRLVMEKQIKTEKQNRKQSMINQAVKDYSAFVLETMKRYKFEKFPVASQDYTFLAATKGKKNIDSMQTAVDQILESVKKDLDNLAARKFSNLQLIKSRKEQILFPDFDQLSDYPPDILMIEIEKRELAHKEKLEKLKREAAEKATREAEAKNQAELKKSERTKQLAIDQKTNAERIAKEAETKRIQAEERRKIDVENAVENARIAQANADQEKKDAIERTKREATEKYQADLDKVAKEKATRESNIQHKGTIMRAAKETLMEIVDEGTAKLIVLAIAQGKIKNVTINY